MLCTSNTGADPDFKAVEDVRHCIVKLPEAMASVHQMYGTRQQASFVMSINTLQMWQELSPASPEGKLHTDSEPLFNSAQQFIDCAVCSCKGGHGNAIG